MGQRRILYPLVVLLGVCYFSAGGEVTGPGPVLPPTEAAMCRLDSIESIPPEGIWEYPGEELRVLIARSPDKGKESFDITVLESFDCSLNEGDRLGWLTPSAEAGKFELHQYSRRKKGILDLPGKCYVTLSKDGMTLLVSPADKLSVSLSPMTLLPRFWRMLRLRFKSGSREPAEGLRKLYPSDTSGQFYRKSRTL